MPPWGIPRRLPLPPLVRSLPSLLFSTTGAFSHCLMRCNIPPSAMRSATTANKLLYPMLAIGPGAVTARLLAKHPRPGFSIVTGYYHNLVHRQPKHELLMLALFGKKPLTPPDNH